MIFMTFRTHKNFLHVMDTFYFCRSNADFFPYKL